MPHLITAGEECALLGLGWELRSMAVQNRLAEQTYEAGAINLTRAGQPWALESEKNKLINANSLLRLHTAR